VNILLQRPNRVEHLYSNKQVELTDILQILVSKTKEKSLETLYLLDFLALSFLFPLIFVILIWLIYDPNIILNSNFETAFLPIISFIKISVAENVSKSSAE